MARRRTTLLALTGLTAGVLAAALPSSAAAGDPMPEKQPLAIGTGGAVATVDPDATQVGLDVLAAGGNAADAAVATAAALGVTEPYSAGVGGGGFFVYYDAATGKVSTIDGRETAPLAMGADAFLDDDRQSSAVRGGGRRAACPWARRARPLTWARALEEFGTLSLSEALQGGIRLADEGFVVDETFRQQTADNEAKFRRFAADRRALPPGRRTARGRLRLPQPRPGATPTGCWPTRASTPFYTGELAEEIVRTVQDPPEAAGRRRGATGTARGRRPGALRRPAARADPRSTTGGWRSTAWRRPRAAARPSVRR